MIAEYNDEWVVTRFYMSVGALENAQTNVDSESSTAELKTGEDSVLVEQLAA